MTPGESPEDDVTDACAQQAFKHLGAIALFILALVLPKSCSDHLCRTYARLLHSAHFTAGWDAYIFSHIARGGSFCIQTDGGGSSARTGAVNTVRCRYLCQGQIWDPSRPTSLRSDVCSTSG